MTTRVLHVSDTHIGKRQYGSDTRREDFIKAFQGAVEIAIHESVDCVLHTGDLFDDSQPNIESINDCARIFRKLSNSGIPFYGVVGNHERKLSSQWLDLFGKFESVHRLSSEPTIINDEVALYGIDAVRKPEWSSYDFHIKEPEDDSLFRILAMHELFEPLVPSYRGNPYELSEVLERLNCEPDAIALGDYHAQVQETVNQIPAFYPGSTERCSTAETAERGVFILTIAPKKEEITFEERTIKSVDTVDAPRPFLSMTVDVGPNDTLSDIEEQLMAEVETKDASIEEYVVSVKVQGEDAISASDIRSLLERKNVKVPHVDDQRSPDITIDVDTPDEGEASDVSTLLEQELEEMELSNQVAEIDKIVRNEQVAKSSLRPRTEQILNPQKKE